MMNSVGSNNTHSTSQPSITILWATQSGHAKACARRTIRLLRSQHNYSSDIRGICSFDDFGFDNLLSLGRNQTTSDNNPNNITLMFVSTTGDAEQCSTIQNTWSSLLSKSLFPQTTLPSLRFALFALGDRAYGPEAFCAAGRKLAARLVQLGGGVVCPLGYGDDGSPNGGVFADLDVWLVEQLFPALEKCGVVNSSAENGISDGHNCSVPLVQDLPYIVEVDNTSTGRSDTSYGDVRDASLEWQHYEYRQFYNNYFQYSCPPTAYQYNNHYRRILGETHTPDPWHSSKTPLLGRVTTNDRITAPEWMQDTRHLRIHVEQPVDPSSTATTNEQQQQSEQLPYQAGDIATILPSNPAHLVSRFLSVLPPSIQSIADTPIRIQQRKTKSRSNFQASSLNHPWPERCTLRGLLTHCADIQSLPEREDLYSLSVYCNLNHPQGKDQRDKLISLSETSGAALYGDYIIREKRNWVDLFYDFDAVRWEGSSTSGNAALMTISHLLAILPSIAPRHFSIASSPFYVVSQTAALESKVGFDLELCVAVVEGKTPFGRSYTGFCSTYLSSIIPRGNDGNGPFVGPDIVRLWIHPGSFSKLPLDTSNEESISHRCFKTPVMCIGAGTGIAPLRSLLMEREARRLAKIGNASFPNTNGNNDNCISDNQQDEKDNILVFGCRKKSMDFYYQSNWDELINNQSLRLVPAFSRDQKHKLYVQRALREADGGSGALIVHHILERNGAVYVAGGSKMARAVREEIVEALGSVLEGGEGDAKKLLNKLKRKGMFSIEAWS